MILTTQYRVYCLLLMETYGFTYSELSKMKPAELEDWFDAHNALYDLKMSEMYDEEDESEEPHQCDCGGSCLECEDCKCENDESEDEELIN